MKTKLKTISIFLVLALLFNIFAPTLKSFAAYSYTITFQLADNNQNEHTLAIESGELKIDNVSVILQDSNNASIGAVSSKSNGTYEITVTNGPSGSLVYGGTNFDLYNTQGHIKYNHEELNSDVVFLVEDYNNGDQANQNNGGEGSQNIGNTVANIVVSAGEGTYTKSVFNPETGLSQNQEIDYDDMVNFYINGSMWDPSSPTISYNSEDTDTTVEFTFETLWINRYYDKIVINGVPYTVSDYLDFDDRTEWLMANHGSQTVDFTIPDVAKADTYNIVVKHGENNRPTFFATFLWTADPEQANGHDYIGHAKLEFVKAEYEVGGTTYTVTGEGIENKLVREGDFDSYHSDDGFLSYGVLRDVDFDDGSLTLPGDSKITMRVVPDYGYQVTSVNGDGEFTTTDDGVSEFTVEVPGGTAGYFQATVEKVDNTVNTPSKNVKSGEITLGKNAASDIKSGTVRLSVEDIKLSSDKIANFQEEASKAGDYTIANYLDINLDKILYKGTSEDVWPEQIHHLTDKALITLQLEEGVNASNIVIVHNIDNGEKFEIIPIESYDSETNTITFYTDSFSNFAIATKDVTTTTTADTTVTNTSANPKTGDNIVMFITVFIISMLGTAVTIKINKK